MSNTVECITGLLDARRTEVVELAGVRDAVRRGERELLQATKCALSACVTVYNETASAIMTSIGAVAGSFFAGLDGGAFERGESGCCICVVSDSARDITGELGAILVSGAARMDCWVRDDFNRVDIAGLETACSAYKSVLVGRHGAEITILVVSKEKNRGKVHSHSIYFGQLCAAVTPKYCAQLDAGTQIDERAFSVAVRFLETRVNAVAIVPRIELPFLTSERDTLQAWQFMDFAMQLSVGWPMEALCGHLSVLPGQFTILRWDALCGRLVPAGDEEEPGATTPLDLYLAPVGPDSIFRNIMTLTEDRVLANSLARAPVVGGASISYLPECMALTDPCESWLELFRQRRRWTNGSVACRIAFACSFTDALRPGARRLRRPALAPAWQLVLAARQLFTPAIFAAGACFSLHTIFGCRDPVALWTVISAILVFCLQFAALKAGKPLGGVGPADRRAGGAQMAAALLTPVFLAQLSVLMARFSLGLAPLLVAPIWLTFLCMLAWGRGRRLQIAALYPGYITFGPAIDLGISLYSAAKLLDVSWGTKGLVRPARATRRAPLLKVATVALLLGAWVGANIAAVWWLGALKGIPSVRPMFVVGQVYAGVTGLGSMAFLAFTRFQHARGSIRSDRRGGF